MTPQQALSLVTQIVEQARLTHAEHVKIQEAMTVLRDVTTPKSSKSDKDKT